MSGSGLLPSVLGISGPVGSLCVGCQVDKFLQAGYECISSWSKIYIRKN